MKWWQQSFRDEEHRIQPTKSVIRLLHGSEKLLRVIVQPSEASIELSSQSNAEILRRSYPE
jgi:hypothetical protein